MLDPEAYKPILKGLAVAIVLAMARLAEHVFGKNSNGQR